MKDLSRKRVFISGPRQCGKTTFAKQILKLSKSSGLYFNWDDPADRLKINRRQWSDFDSYFAEKLNVERALVIVAKPSKALWKKGRLQAMSVHERFQNGNLL